MATGSRQTSPAPAPGLSDDALRRLLNIHRHALTMRHALRPLPEPSVAPSSNQAPAGGRLFVDMTRLAHRRTEPNSIDRVCLRLYQGMLALGRASVPAVFVNGRWFEATLDANANENVVDRPLISQLAAPIEGRRGDRLLVTLLDLNLTPEQVARTQMLRDAGVELIVTLHDLLPLTHPEWNNSREILRFDLWLRRYLAIADRVWCTTRHVASLFAAWLRILIGEPSQPRPPIRPIGVLISPLGCDAIGATRETPDARTKPADRKTEPAAARASAPFSAVDDLIVPRGQTPTFLCVATLHPRKGVDTLLDAFEQLWAQGADLRLILSGRAVVESLRQRVLNHPEMGRRLLYAGYLSDAALRAAARQCCAMIVPSREEGFGLPVMEASALGLPVIARDIPVFREIAGEHCFYFDDSADRSLAERLRAWLAMPTQDRERFSTRGIAIDWREAAAHALVKLDTGHADYRFEVPQVPKRPQ